MDKMSYIQDFINKNVHFNMNNFVIYSNTFIKHFLYKKTQCTDHFNLPHA